MAEETALIPRPAGDLSAGSLFFNVEKFTHAQRVATALASSTMVPEHYRGKDNMGNVLIALNFAERTALDPFMVMQNLYVVHGRPGIEAKLAIALVNNTGRFTPLSWTLEGEGKARKATCHAKRKDTGEVCRAECSMALAEAEGWVGKAGSKWKTMPDMMLQYRSATFFARLYCPEALLGLQTREELRDAIPVEGYAEDTPAADPPESLSSKLKRPRKPKDPEPEPATPGPETVPPPTPAGPEASPVNPKEGWFECAAVGKTISPDGVTAALCAKCPRPDAPECGHFVS